MNLSEKFFVKDKHGDVYLVTKEDYGYFLHEDFTLNNYDGTDSNSIIISESELIKTIETGNYKMIPEEEGFINFIDMELQELEGEE